MANILLRMLNSFAMMHADFAAGTQSHLIHPARHCSGNKAVSAAAIFGIFRGCRNPLKRWASSIVEPRDRLNSPPRSRFDIFPDRTAETSMTITTAHIQPIVALIAGVLILIMPRFLNLVVAIYLICVGLIGLGVLKWLHM
jgi:hypothetical protein